MVCVVLNLLGSHFVVIQILKLDFKGLKRPAFPVPLSTEINCRLKVMTNDRMASLSVVSGLTHISLNLSSPPC